jgi:hypothetical protein
MVTEPKPSSEVTLFSTLEAECRLGASARRKTFLLKAETPEKDQGEEDASGGLS